MNENIENVLATLDGFRTNDEITYSAYSTLHDEISLLDDLLKEQEPVKPVLSRIGNYAAINDYTCPVCGTDLYHHQKYCDECGSEVKWDETK